MYIGTVKLTNTQLKTMSGELRIRKELELEKEKLKQKEKELESITKSLKQRDEETKKLMHKNEKMKKKMKKLQEEFEQKKEELVGLKKLEMNLQKLSGGNNGLMETNGDKKLDDELKPGNSLRFKKVLKRSNDSDDDKNNAEAPPAADDESSLAKIMKKDKQMDLDKVNYVSSLSLFSQSFCSAYLMMI